MTTNKPIYLYSIEPQKMSAGTAGGLELFFDCGECLSQEPAIYGFLDKSLDYSDMIIFKKGEEFYPACLCKKCCKEYESRVKASG